MRTEGCAFLYFGLTKDVRQVLSYVETGNVDAGIVYRTDALISENVKVVTSADTNTHPLFILWVLLRTLKILKRQRISTIIYKAKNL